MRLQAPKHAHSASRSTRPRTCQVRLHCNYGTHTKLSTSPAPQAPEPASLGRKLASIALAAAVALSPLVPAANVAASEPIATSSAALELQQAYDKYSASYDELDGGAAADALGFPQLRAQLLAKARGRTLEVAVGTGLNLQYYSWAAASTAGGSSGSASPGSSADADAPSASSSSSSSAPAAAGPGVTSLDTVDLSPGMLDQARARVRGSAGLAGRPIAFQQADVAALPYADSSFDTVVDTFSLCVFPDPQAALNELARVVRPANGSSGGSSSRAGGRVLLLEHSRSDNPLLAAYQDATAGPVAALGKGCVWNQDVEGMAARAGLSITRAERFAGGTVELLVAEKQ